MCILFQLLHTPSLVDLQAVVSLAPTVVALLSDIDLTPGIGHCFALRQHDLRLQKHVDDLLWLVLPLHFFSFPLT